jgi:hypothetical protein
MLHGLSSEERKQAAVSFGSTMGMMMLFAGATGVGGVYGLPLTTIAAGVSNFVRNRLDPDHHHDTIADIHSSLTDRMGRTAADAVMTGPLGAVTGASLSGGASYNDLWYRPPEAAQSWPETLADVMFQALGPIAAIPRNAAQGAMLYTKGATAERAAEHFMPPEAAAIMKAYRYYTQGATNIHGRNILPSDESINAWDIARQAVGFTPQKVASAYKRNAAVENEKADLDQRKKELQDDLEEAIDTKNYDKLTDLERQVALWNKINPGLAVQAGSVAGAMRQKAKNDATAVQGLALPRGYQYLNEKYK